MNTTRLEQILSQWHEAHRQQFVRDGLTNLLDSFDQQEKKHTHVGAKYARLDVGGSGAWMLEIATGDIYGIKAYGTVDKKKCAGNINDPCFNGSVLFRDRFRHGQFDWRSFHSADCPVTAAAVKGRSLVDAVNRIILTLGIGGWVARYAGPHREEIVRLFETDVLPTPFTFEAQASVVREEIAKLNPGVVVEVL